MQRSEEMIFKSNPSPQLMLPIANLMEEVRSVITEKDEFEYRERSFLEFSDYQHSDAGNKIDSFSMECLATS